MFEVLNKFLPKVHRSEVLKKMSLKEGSYFVVSAHREENINNGSNFSNLTKVLNKIAEEYNLPVIVSTHPRTRKMIEKTKYQLSSENNPKQAFGVDRLPCIADQFKSSFK